MRRALAAALALATALTIVSVSAAGGEATPKRYLRMSASAFFVYDLTYSDHPDATFHGNYLKAISYQVRAIVVYDGRRVSAPPNSMIVSGSVTLIDRITEWRGPGDYRPRRCSNTQFKDPQDPERWFTQTGRRGEYQFAKSGGINISGGAAVIDPGDTIKWSMGCSASEQLENHGLPGGPSISVPAPPRSLFSGRKVFATSCNDSYDHGFEPGDVNGHEFHGQVDMAVRFTPFPASALPQAKKQLRDIARTVGNGNWAEGIRQRSCL